MQFFITLMLRISSWCVSHIDRDCTPFYWYTELTPRLAKNHQQPPVAILTTVRLLGCCIASAVPILSYTSSMAWQTGMPSLESGRTCKSRHCEGAVQEVAMASSLCSASPHKSSTASQPICIYCGERQETDGQIGSEGFLKWIRDEPQKHLNK